MPLTGYDDVYLGNPNLKKANTRIEFTQEQILEFVACKNDPVYFAQQHVKIVSLYEGLFPFQPYDFQKKLIENLENQVDGMTNILQKVLQTLLLR